MKKTPRVIRGTIMALTGLGAIAGFAQSALADIDGAQTTIPVYAAIVCPIRIDNVQPLSFGHLLLDTDDGGDDKDADDAYVCANPNTGSFNYVGVEPVTGDNNGDFEEPGPQLGSFCVHGEENAPFCVTYDHCVTLVPNRDADQTGRGHLKLDVDVTNSGSWLLGNDGKQTIKVGGKLRGFEHASPETFEGWIHAQVSYS